MHAKVLTANFDQQQERRRLAELRSHLAIHLADGIGSSWPILLAEVTPTDISNTDGVARLVATAIYSRHPGAAHRVAALTADAAEGIAAIGAARRAWQRGHVDLVSAELQRLWGPAGGGR